MPIRNAQQLRIPRSLRRNDRQMLRMNHRQMLRNRQMLRVLQIPRARRRMVVVLKNSSLSNTQ